MNLSKQQKRDFKGIVLSIAVFISLSIVFAYDGFKQMEWLADDFKTQHLREGKTTDDQVVILLVDEASLGAMDSILGRWPWPRSVWADVLEYMSMGGAASVAYDILFTESSLGSMHERESEHDLAFVQISQESGIATHAMQLLFDDNNPDANKPLPDIFDRFSIPNVKGIPPSQNDTFYIPFEGLYQAARNMAVVEFSPDSDGDYRRTNLFRDYQGQFYPVLSTATLMDILNIQSVEQDSEAHRMKINDMVVPLDRDNHYQVNFYENFETYSIASVLASIARMREGDLESVYTNERLVPPDVFADKIVFIGTSAVGLEDMKSTPMDARWPGVFLHASIVSNLLQQDFIYQVKSYWVYLAMFLLSMLTALAVLSHTSITLQLAYPSSLLVLYLVGNIALQHYFSLQMDVVAPVMTVFATWLVVNGYLSATEGREKKRVRTMLAQYVSPAALNSVLDNYEDQISAEIGKKEEMSVVFSDIRGFTSISENLSAEEVVKLLNIHLDAMTKVTFHHGGTMDKFIGDATMAFWGAPLPDPDHPLHATQAAIAMYRAVVEVNQELAALRIPKISIGVGVNTGQVVLGNIGSSQKLDYTVIGDSVNLGARLEGLTKEYGVGVLVSEFTREHIYRQIPCALIDLVRVKGKDEPVKIYFPLGLDTDENYLNHLDAVKLCEEAFKLYHQKRFSQANQLFQRLPDEYFGRFKQIYEARCVAYLKVPPGKSWDGVFTLTTK